MVEQHRRLLVAGEQGLVGHDQVDLDRHPVRGGLAGEAFEGGVGHQLAPGAALDAVAGADPGVGVALQGGVGADALGDREQDRQLGHRLGHRAQGDPPVGRGPVGPLHRAARVEPVGRPPGLAFDPPIAPLRQLRGQLGIDGGALRPAQPGRLPRHQHGAPLGDPAGLQRGVGAGQLGDQDRGPADRAGRGVRRAAPGQPDLGRDPAPRPFQRHPLGELLGLLGRRERRRLPGLRRRRGRLQLLQRPDPGHPHRIIDVLAQPAQRSDQPVQETGRPPCLPAQSNTRTNTRGV